MNVVIRKAIEADATPIFNLLYFGALDQYPGSDGFDADKADGMIRALISTTMVATVDDVIVGMLMISIDEPWYSRTRFMRDIVFFVQPEARASTAAVRLIKSALKASRKSGLPLVLQHTSGEDMLRKDDFYRRMGLRQLGGVFIFEG